MCCMPFHMDFLFFSSLTLRTFFRLRISFHFILILACVHKWKNDSIKNVLRKSNDVLYAERKPTNSQFAMYLILNFIAEERSACDGCEGMCGVFQFVAMKRDRIRIMRHLKNHVWIIINVKRCNRKWWKIIQNGNFIKKSNKMKDGAKWKQWPHSKLLSKQGKKIYAPLTHLKGYFNWNKHTSNACDCEKYCQWIDTQNIAVLFHLCKKKEFIFHSLWQFWGDVVCAKKHSNILCSHTAQRLPFH